MAQTQAEYLSTWQHRLTALENNKEEVQHLETRREKLQGIHDGALAAIRDQAAATALKQEASKRLEALIKEGRKVDTFLTTCLREHYGDRNEKLEEFLVKPFRGRRSKKLEKKPAEPQAPPAENGK
jgi:DNA repair ATPase RecN